MEKTAKYLEVVNWIKEKIRNRELLPGERMYSENELKQIFSLSRQTIRHAVGVLEEEGLVTRIRGSGTYITDTRMNILENRTRIAVVTTYVDSYIFPKTIQGIEKVLFEQGYSVQIAFTNNQTEREKTVLEDIISRDDVAGIIIEATKSSLANPNLELYRKLMARKIPVLFINSYYKELEAPHVTLDDRHAANIAVKYLLKCGHSKIGGIFKLDDGQGNLRYEGYLHAMQEAGRMPQEENIVWLDTLDVKEFELCGEKILRRLAGCTAVLCYNDQIAMHLFNLLKQNAVRVPEDMSIISIDDSELASLCEVALTSVPHPMDRLGAKAAENLLRMIQKRDYDGNYEFQMEIAERASVINKL